MKKILGLFSLILINCSALYLIYLYVATICSTKINNFLHVPYEPSGMQLIYYFISFPLFMILAFLSQIHSYYFDLRKSLFFGITIIWFSYFVLSLYVDLVIHYSAGDELLYYGTLLISCIAISYLIYLTFIQFIQLVKDKME